MKPFAIDLREAIYAIQWALVKIESDHRNDLPFRRAHIELSTEFNGKSGKDARHDMVSFAHALNSDSVSKLRMTMLPMKFSESSGVSPEEGLTSMASSIVDAVSYARKSSSEAVNLIQGATSVTLALVVTEDSRIEVASPAIMQSLHSVLTGDDMQGKVVVHNSITVDFADGDEAESAKRR